MRHLYTSLLLFVSLVFFMPSCSVAGGTYTITGTINKPEGSLVILSQITDQKLITLDSATVDKKGKFAFSGEATDEALLHYLTFETSNPPGVPVVLKNGYTLNFKVEMSDLSSQIFDYEVEGTEDNKLMAKLHSIYTEHDKDMIAFNKKVSAMDPDSASDEQRRAVQSAYNSMLEERTKSIQAFIENEKASPATYFAVRYLFQTPDPQLITIGSKKMSAEMPESSYTKTLNQLVSQLGPVEGAEAPDIELQSPEGEVVKLSSLRGKIVLIDFWASWCGPCRRENPNVVKLYNRYKDKGFEIYGVSLDNNAEKWKAAIAKDGLTWYHVSDLKGWKSSAAQLYRVNAIPQTFLIDKEGKIIKAGLRGAALEQALASLLD